MSDKLENLKKDLGILLAQNDEVQSEEEKIAEEISTDRREEILQIQDPSLIGLDEYAVFLNYAIANIFKILRTQIKTKIPDNVTINEMGKESISLAIYTYNIDKAIESNAAFRTHLGWKCKQVVTDYARALKKATKNELNTADEEFKKNLEDNVLTTDAEGKETFNEDIDMPEYQETERQTLEQMKKLEWAMRQVRYELPRENNLILDVGIGEIKKEDDRPFSLIEWAQFTGQKESTVRKVFSSSKKLLKQKLYRKGFLDILVDEEKTTEDLMKDTNIEEQTRAREQDESIIESTDIKTLITETDDFMKSLNNLDELLKD